MSAAVLAAALTLSPMTIAHNAAVVPKDQAAFAHCVAQRESHGNYRARGDHSSARGKYQFLDASWRRGLAYMTEKRLKSFGMKTTDAKRIRLELQSKSIDRWTPVFQDVAFLAALNARGKWSGAHHWFSHNSPCNRLAKS
jgi:hypothetical protein